MKFVATPLPDAFVIEPERKGDERGGFARIYCAREFADHGLDVRIAQCSLSWNHTRGTLRGLHYQQRDEETKVVRAIAGVIFDVIVDLRPGSSTYRRWFGIELSAETALALYVPAGFAHGFLTLADATVIHYQISEFYNPDAARGVRWDDPTLAIAWPFAPTCMSERDRNLPWLPR